MWNGIDSGSSGQYRIKYSKYDGSSWSAWMNISGLGNDASPSIAIDSQDNLHVVWSGGYDSVNNTFQIRYSKYNGSSWNTWTNIQNISGYDQSYPSIVIDSLSNLHVVWHGKDAGNPSYLQIKYSKYSGESWSVWTNIQSISGYVQQFPCIAVDSTDKMYVLWQGKDTENTTYTQIKYSSCTSNCEYPTNWSSWINKTSSANATQGYPTLRWSRWNNNSGTLDWGWTDGTTVRFSKDETVNMSP